MLKYTSPDRNKGTHLAWQDPHTAGIHTDETFGQEHAGRLTFRVIRACAVLLSILADEGGQTSIEWCRIAELLPHPGIGGITVTPGRTPCREPSTMMKKSFRFLSYQNHDLMYPRVIAQ